MVFVLYIFSWDAGRNTRTTYKIGGNFFYYNNWSMIFSLLLITFFINLSAPTIKSLNLNCSNNVFPFSEKLTWQRPQDALDGYKEQSLNVMPSACCVEFVVCRFR